MLFLVMTLQVFLSQNPRKAVLAPLSVKLIIPQYFFFFFFEMGDNCGLKACWREQNISFRGTVYVCEKSIDNILRNI